MDIPTAAQRLGISSEAVRKRIKRGLLTAERAEGRVYVRLPTNAPAAQTPGDARADSDPDAVRPSPDAVLTSPDGGSDNAVNLVDHLSGEVIFLRAQLEAQQQAATIEISALQERLREAHLLLAQRPALPSGADAGIIPTPPATPAAEHSAPLRPWWHRW